MVELILEIDTPVAGVGIDGDGENRPPIGGGGQRLTVGGEGDPGALGLQAEGIEGAQLGGVGGDAVGNLRPFRLGHTLVGAEVEQAGDGTGAAVLIVGIAIPGILVPFRVIVGGGDHGHPVLLKRGRDRRRLEHRHRHVVLHGHRDQAGQRLRYRIPVIIGDTHLHVLAQVGDRQGGVIPRSGRMIHLVIQVEGRRAGITVHAEGEHHRAGGAAGAGHQGAALVVVEDILALGVVAGIHSARELGDAVADTRRLVRAGRHAQQVGQLQDHRIGIRGRIQIAQGGVTIRVVLGVAGILAQRVLLHRAAHGLLRQGQHRHVVFHRHRDQAGEGQGHRVAVRIGGGHLHVLAEVGDGQQGVVTRGGRVVHLVVQGELGRTGRLDREGEHQPVTGVRLDGVAVLLVDHGHALGGQAGGGAVRVDQAEHQGARAAGAEIHGHQRQQVHGDTVGVSGGVADAHAEGVIERVLLHTNGDGVDLQEGLVIIRRGLIIRRRFIIRRRGRGSRQGNDRNDHLFGLGDHAAGGIEEIEAHARGLRAGIGQHLHLVRLEHDDLPTAATRPGHARTGRRGRQLGGGVDLAVLERRLDLRRLGDRIGRLVRTNAGVNVLVHEHVGHAAEIQVAAVVVEDNGDTAVRTGDDPLAGVDGAVGREQPLRAVGSHSLDGSVNDECFADRLGLGCDHVCILHTRGIEKSG